MKSLIGKAGLRFLLCFLLILGVQGCGLLQFAPLLLLLPADEDDEPEAPPPPPPPPPTGPVVTGVVPGVGPMAGGTSVSVTGLRFQNGCTVLFGSNAAGSVTFFSDTQVDCTTPLSTVEGPVSVTVTNPDTEFHTLAAGFTYDGTAPGEVTGFTATPGN
ncbi:MAG: IPT/TIG domain-containing protein, partial [Planctomycetota bacterium]